MVAAAAAGRARDFHAALRIAEPPPHGDAIEREACYDELKIVAANAALAAGLLDRVERLAAAISDTTEALLVRAEPRSWLASMPPQSRPSSMRHSPVPQIIINGFEHT